MGGDVCEGTWILRARSSLVQDVLVVWDDKAYCGGRTGSEQS